MMKNVTILVIEDEKAVRDMLGFAFAAKGCQIIEARDAQQALVKLEQQHPDIVLLDWMLPDMSGIEFIRRFRQTDGWQKIPVIMLTARGSEEDKVRGLESGADDYVTKPFSVRELEARIKAQLRRTKDIKDQVVTVDKVTMDVAAHSVSVAGQPVQLGPTEFKLLRFFLLNTGRVHSREQLLDQVWGRNVYVEERTVDVHIRRLRKALAGATDAAYIQTVRGFGYRFSI